MNQTNNFIQWKNLTDEQKAEHDFENYKYEFQVYTEWFPLAKKEPSEDIIYRLVIEKDNWYYAHGQIKLGKDWDSDEIEEACECYPVKPDEISKQETIDDRIKAKWPQYEVVMLDFGEAGMLEIQSGIKKYNAHIVAQSMKGFQGFVYIHSDNDWLISNKPTKSSRNKYIQPVAALFEKGE